MGWLRYDYGRALVLFGDKTGIRYEVAYNIDDRLTLSPSAD